MRINYDKLSFNELRLLRDKIETDTASRSKIGPFFYLSRAVERLNEINYRIRHWPKGRGGEVPGEPRRERPRAGSRMSDPREKGVERCR